MVSHRWRKSGWCVALAAYLGLGGPGLAWAEPPGKPGDDQTRDAQALAARIDQLLGAGLTAAKVEPAPLADDAEFMRRLYLDLGGRIPSVAEARAFLDDPKPDKRRRLVERLLNGPAYVNHFANVWRSLLLPEINTNFDF